MTESGLEKNYVTWFEFFCECEWRAARGAQ